jgi:hypothetical protein
VTTLRDIAIGRHPRRTLIRIAVLAVFSFITFGWLLTPVRVRGISWSRHTTTRV